MLSRANKKIQALIIVGIVLLTIRFAIPPALEYYVTAILNDMPGYTARIERLKIDFLTAGYSLDSVRLYKPDQEIPFVVVSKVDVNIQWESLLHGGVVTEIGLHKPTLNFVAPTTNGTWKSEEDTDWTILVKKLSFFPVNQVTVKDGALSFKDFNREPAIEVYLRNIDIESHNLVSVTSEADALPSRVFAKAQSSGNGSLSMAMKLNTLKALPDLDLDLKLENVDMRSLRDFVFAYARIDVLRGNFNLYSEVTVMDGKVDGYVKPRLDNVTFNRTQPVRMIMGKFQQPGLIETTGDQPGSRIPLDANVHTMNSNFWPVLWNLFRNASVEGFEQNTRKEGYLASGGETL